MSNNDSCSHCRNKIVLDKISMAIMLIFIGFIGYSIGRVNERNIQEADHKEYINSSINSERERIIDLRNAYDFRLGDCERSLSNATSYQLMDSISSMDDIEDIELYLAIIWDEYYLTHLQYPNPLID